ncbi:MAG: methionine synthase [Gemmatimonadota bacterium]
MPGTDPAEAMRIILGELPDLPHLAELPGRGAGAGLTGRTAALLVEMPVELTPTGWRFTGRPGRDLRRARDLLSSDLDTLEEFAAGYTGPLKVQAAGPWTLAATIELLRSQERALTDRGAVADLTESLGEGLRAHLDQITKRVPGATILLQLDEPALPGVLAGTLRSASGLRRLEPPEAPEAENRLAAVLAATGAFSIVHCCALSVPFGMIRSAGAGAVSFDLAQLGPGGEDALAETVEAGLGILAGVVPATPAPGGQLAARATAERVTGLWRQMGWPAGRKPGLAAGPAGLPGQVVLTPACGLAGAPPGYAKDALARCREAARLLPELIEEG